MSEPKSGGSGLERLKADLRLILDSALGAVDPYKAVHSHVIREGRFLKVDSHRYDLEGVERVIVVGAGKGSARMAVAIEEILGDLISEGLINVKYGHGEPLRKITVWEAGHPVPDQSGIDGARRLLTLVKDATERDLVICLISGGGSSLLPQPTSGIDLISKQETTRALLESGATIHQVNAVRKHISDIKGGRLAQAATPARVVSLLLSDVIGDDLDVIASGPTVPDTTTFATALDVLARYDLTQRVPANVLSHLQAGARNEHPETPKPGDAVFQNVVNVIIANNAGAINAAAKCAGSLGYNPMVLSSFVQGEAREVARVMAAIAREIAVSGRPIPRPTCVIAGGETTVTLKGKGTGGRNQELALQASLDIENIDNILILAAGTDGTDGPTDAAGAIASGNTLAAARGLGLSARDYLANNDSYHFFEAIGDLVVTGPTGTNVMDIILILAGR
ncbi:MAG: glycerate kinase [Firmicutes bacterium]|nr:glycerate kinase [Bacillota bacterium]